MRRPLALLLPLLLLSACDKRTDEELRSMIEEVADAKVKPVVEANEKLGKDLAARQQDLDEHKKRITAIESQVADLSAQTVGLEAELAEAQKRLDTLESKVDKPTPPPIAGRPDPAAYYNVTIGDAQGIGPDDALVTIVTWSDFQCPYCSRVSPTIDELRKEYGADLRYVFKHNPLGFHKDARPAALAAEAAGEQGKFWEMHDKLFENSRDLTRANFVKWARELGLDV
jgi:protein-disulfide isomerase